MRDKYLYLHIPKTGGVSFRLVLENSVSASEILHFRIPDEIEKFTDASLSQYRFVHGHFRANNIKHLSSFKVIVSLRNPVSRCLSVYNFLKSLDATDPIWPEKSKRHIMLAQSHSIDDMMDHADPFVRQHFHNMQTRILAGVVDPQVEINEGHLACAIEALLGFDFIATNEELEFCKMLMCKKYELYCPDSPVYLNSSKIKSVATDRLRLKILDSNKFDARLLEFVHSRNLVDLNNVAVF